MTSNNADWEKWWFYLRNDSAGLPPYTGKVLMAKTDTWHHSMSLPTRQQRLESLTTVLRRMEDAGLGAASIMERELCIFEMSDAANPISLALSRLLQERLLKEYAVTWARRAIRLKVVPHSDDDLWSFAMLPDAQPVSRVFLSLRVLISHFYST
jgi:hypothetical protein